MKKILVLGTALFLSAGSAFAANGFGDGSVENTYVPGQSAATSASQDYSANHPRYYTRGNSYGDGSVEDSYYVGRHLNSPVDQHAASGMKDWGGAR